jgi:hypothetical protein
MYVSIMYVCMYQSCDIMADMICHKIYELLMSILNIF